MITKHGIERMFQRVDNLNYKKDIKKLEKQAWSSGRTIEHYKQYPKLFANLQEKKNRSHTNKIRIYQNMIFIWKGQGGKGRRLITVIPIRDTFLKEMEELQ